MAEKDPRVDVQFFVNGEPRTSRVWQHVPRVGDEVMLPTGGDGEKAPYRVVRVVWGVEEPRPFRQAANIELEPI